MKTFKKAIALLLTALMVVTALPLTVFADAWVEITGGTVDTGESSESKLTITIDADKLTEILQMNGVSSSLLDELKQGVTIDQTAIFNIFTMEEIFEIVPQDVLLGAVDMDALLKQIDVTKYINVSELLSQADVDVKALLDLLPEGEKIEDYVDMSVLVKYVDPADAIGYVRLNDLIKYVNIELFVEKAGDDLEQIVVFSELFADDLVVLNEGAVALEDIKNAGILTSEIVNRLLAEGAIKEDKVAELFDENVTNPLDYFNRVTLENEVYPFINAEDFIDKITIDLSVFGKDDVYFDKFSSSDINSDLVKDLIDFEKIKSLVDYETVTQYIDVAEVEKYIIFSEVNKYVDVDAVKSFISVDAVKKYIDLTLFEEYYIDTDAVELYLDFDKIRQYGDFGVAKNYLSADIIKNHIGYIDFDRFDADDVNVDLLVLGEDYTVDPVTDTAELTSLGWDKIKEAPQTYLKGEVWEDIQDDPMEYLTPMGADAVMSDPINFLNSEGWAKYNDNPMDFLTEDGVREIKNNPKEFLKAEGQEKLEEDPTFFLTVAGKETVENDPLSFLSTDGNIEYQNDPMSFLTPEGKTEVTENPLDYLTQEGVDKVNADLLSFLNEEGKTKFETNPVEFITDKGIDEIKKNPYAFLNEQGKEDFDKDPLSFLTTDGEAAIKADPIKYLSEDCKKVMRAEPQRYLTDAGMEKLLEQVLDQVSFVEIIEMYRDVPGFTTALLNSADLEKVMELDGFTDCVDYAKAISIIGVENIINNPDIHIDYSKLDLSKLKTASNIDKYIRKENLKLFTTDDLYAIFGGQDNLMSCVDMEAAMADSALLNKVFTAIQNDESVALDEVVYVSKFLSVVDYMDVLHLLGYDSPLELLGEEALKEILKTVDLTPHMSDLLKVVFERMLWNVDLLVVGGDVVAKEDPDSATLAFDAQALLKTLFKLLPSLEEIAALESNLLIETEVGMTYRPEPTDQMTAPGDPKTKNIKVEVLLDGDISNLKKAAAKLDELLKRYVEFYVNADGSIYLGITAPELETPQAFADLVKRVLNTDRLPDELKQKLLEAVNADGVIGFVDTLALSDVVTILDAVDPEALYDALMGVSYVETVVERLEAKTGIILSDLTLDEMKDLIFAKDAPTMERICEIIEKSTGRDVRAILDGVADRMDGLLEFERAQQLLATVEAKLNYDLSDISIADLLDRAADQSLTDRIVELVSRKVGVDVMEILQSNTAQELYDAALAKLDGKTGAFNKVKNYVDALGDVLPDRVMQYRLADSYRGNSRFQEDLTLKFNAKEMAEKILRKVASRVDLGALEDKMDLVMSLIPDAQMTAYLDVSLRLTDFYQITFMNRAGTETYTSVFMPKGADLSIYKNTPSFDGYTFTAWADAEGNAVETMPAKDIVVYADLALKEVTFINTDGSEIIKLYVESGSIVSAQDIAAIEALVLLPPVNQATFRDYTIRWKKDQKLVSLASLRITEDMTLVADLKPNYYFDLGDDIDYDVTYDPTTGIYHVRILQEFDTLAREYLPMPREDILARIRESEKDSIAFSYLHNGVEFEFLTVDKDTLTAIYNMTQEGDLIEIHFLTDLDPELLVGVEHPFYTAHGTRNDMDAYRFEIMIRSAGEPESARRVLDIERFAGHLILTFPFENTITNSDGSVKTMIHYITENTRESITVHAIRNGFISFAAPHFSDYVISNEHKVNVDFLLDSTGERVTDGCYLAGLDEYYPAGATLTLDPVLGGRYDVERIEVNGVKLEGNTYTTKTPGEVTNIKVYLIPREYNIFYIVNGTLYKTQTYRGSATLIDISEVINNEAIVSPRGYTKEGAEWYYDKSKIGVEDLYAVAKWKPIEYTVHFVSDETQQTISYQFNIENYQDLIAPAVPEIAGMSGAWEAYDLSKIFDTDQRELTVKAVYTARTYAVVIRDAWNGTTILHAKPGAVVELPAIVGNDSYLASVGAVDANGNVVAIDEKGCIVMPAATVYVAVTYTPATIVYTVNGTAYAAPYGSTVTVDVPVAPGQVFTSITDGCTFIGSTDLEDGTTVLHYAFTLTQPTDIVYVVSGESSDLIRIMNGNIYSGTENPADISKKIKFSHWAEALNGVGFAAFKLEASQSLLWLWILLIVLAVILLIVTVYMLYIRGRIKPNIITLGISWIVTFFFMLCMKIADLGMKLARLIGKSDDPNAYGFFEPKSEAPKAAAKKEVPKATASKEAPKMAPSAAPKANTPKGKKKKKGNRPTNLLKNRAKRKSKKSSSKK